MARIMLTMPDELLTEIDQGAKSEHRSRSEFLREIVRYYLRQAKPTPPRSTVSVEAVGAIERLRSQAIERAQDATESTEVIRSFRGSLTTPSNYQGKELEAAQPGG